MEAALLTAGATLEEASSAALAWSLEGFAVILKAAEAVLHTAFTATQLLHSTVYSSH